MQLNMIEFSQILQFLLCNKCKVMISIIDISKSISIENE